MFIKTVSFVALALLITSSSALPHRSAERAVEDLQVIRRGMIDIDDPSIAARNPEPFINFGTASVDESGVSEREANPQPYYPPTIPVGKAIHKRQEVKVEEASRSDGGRIVPYKRDLVERQGVKVEEASRSDGGRIVPYKRDLVERQEVKVEEASRSDGGRIVPYKRDLVERQVKVEEASRSDGGRIVPYKRDLLERQEVKVEEAATTKDGKIVSYEENGATKRNILKLSSAGPARRGGRLYKRANVRSN